MDKYLQHNQQAWPHTWVAAAPKELIRDFILVASSAADWRIALLPMSLGTYILRFNPAWQLDPRIKELNLAAKFWWWPWIASTCPQEPWPAFSPAFFKCRRAHLNLSFFLSSSFNQTLEKSSFSSSAGTALLLASHPSSSLPRTL